MILVHQHDDDVVEITLNRPEKHNAMLPGMLQDLRTAVLEHTSAGALLINGAGSSFCAGFDLKACAADPDGGTMRSLLNELSSVVVALRSAPAPVVMAVHGVAVAGGCALLGGADIVVADQNTRLGYPVVKIGVSPAVSSPFMLASLPHGAVRSRLLDPNLISAGRALSLGIVHEVVDHGLTEIAMRHAASLANKPGIGCKATKEWLNQVCPVLDSDVQSGLQASLQLTGGDEERNRLAAIWS